MRSNTKIISLISAFILLISVFVPTISCANTTITVSFDTAGGTKIPDVVLNNESLWQAGKIPEDPVKDGYTFMGWYPNTEFFDWQSGEYIMHEIFEQDTTLYALFIPNDKVISEINVSVASPVVGDEVTINQVIFEDEYGGYGYEEASVIPEVTILDKNAPYEVSEARWVVTGEDYYKSFEGTIEANTNYIADVMVYLPEESEYRFSKSLTITANGEEPIEIGSVSTTYAGFMVKVASTTEKPAEELPKIVAAENNAINNSAAEAVNKLVEDIANGKEVKGVSAELKEKVSAAFDAGKTVTVEVKTPEVKREEVKEDAAKIEEKLGKNAAVAALYDITVVIKVDGESVGNVTNTGEEVTLKLPVPKDLPAVPSGYTRVFTVYKVHEGVVTKLETTQENDELLANSNEFSTYAVTYEDVKNTTNPPTGDNIAMVVSLFIISVIGLAVVIKK